MLGMIIGVPIFAVIYAAIKSLVNKELIKKGMPDDTANYLNVGSVDEEGFHEFIPESKQLKKVSKSKRTKNSFDEIHDNIHDDNPEDKE